MSDVPMTAEEGAPDTFTAAARGAQERSLAARLTRPSRWFDPQPQDLVITLLGAFTHPVGRASMWSGGLVEVLGEFGFSVGAARIALARLVRRDLLARIRDGRLVHYRVTPRCEQLLDEGDRRIFSLGREEHRAELWTILWHTIPEDQRMERARLARRLRFLGFGPVQDGTWASPHDREQEVTALLQTLGIMEFAFVLLGRPAASLDFRGFVDRVWDLDDLAARYEAFTKEYSEFMPARAVEGMSDRDAFLLRTRLVHTFRNFPFADPELPDDYMPEPGHRAEAVHVFHTVYAALAEAGQRHFDAVTRSR